MSLLKNALFSIEHVSKTFVTGQKTIHALSDVSFTVDKGELVVIIGPSGCGKTTLLKLLAHLILPTQGNIVDRDHRDDQKEKISIGFVFQNPTLMPWRKIIHNIILPLQLIGKKQSEMKEKAEKLTKLLHLHGFENVYPTELSEGMSQRVGIARALIHNPPILLMDEPFSASDELLRQKLDFELLSIKQKMNKTIVFVTHNILEAVILADKLIIMGQQPNTILYQERIQFENRTPELLNNPRFFKKVMEIRNIIDANTKKI